MEIFPYRQSNIKGLIELPEEQGAKNQGEEIEDHYNESGKMISNILEAQALKA